ncbi:MAG TPA: ATP-dependent RecD-like DNA helicase [Roseiflexaceae bacterium]|nr:ATP-dependent RecD-like DNA helicase [Roseiflexaceae bacterium]
MHIEATLERITFHSEHNGYTVARVRLAGKGTPITIVGKLLGAQVGETLALDGRWVDHPEHGRQFEVEGFRALLPATVEGIRRYLGSGLIKGIGPATAKRIVDTFGAGTLQVIEHEPHRLGEVAGLGPHKATLITRAWQEQQQIKTIMLFLQDLNLSPAIAVRIYKQYGTQALGIIRTNPYRIADDVYGIGFLTADEIARGLGMPHDAPQRIAAGLRYALSRATDDGHCFLPWEELTGNAAELLSVDRPQVDATLADVVAAREVHCETWDAERIVYLLPFAHAERGLAQRILELQRHASPMAAFFAAANWPRVFAHLAERRSIALTERQQQAVQMALTSQVSILTGGPGTGKTTTLRTVIMALQQRGYRYLLASPTGRAAKRLAEATGAPATTIHRLLEYAPASEAQFKRNEERPLVADLIIIDEASMLDVILAYHLLKAVPPGAHLLFVGDADQLPSVGPGRVLHDLIESLALPSTHLDLIFRQAADSGIISNAHRINHGEHPEFDNLDDCFFFPRAEPEGCAALTVELVTERIPRRFGLDPLRDIQVLSPTHRGPAGVAALNSALQAALNPPIAQRAERRAGTATYRVGDRVLQLRNNYDLDVYNGDIGEIVAIDTLEQILRVRYDGMRTIAYDFNQLDELTLAYAISIHKSQGAEYPCVVIPLLLQHQPLLQRNLLYTAITRARRLVVLAGDRRAIALAVRNHQVTRRYTGLVRRLRP